MFKTINLEMSLKPFKKTDDEYIKSVCQKIFRQWYPLLKNRQTISVMLWVADGSEILDYNGKLNDTFEWCYFLGNANAPLLKENETKDISLHERKQYYIEKPPVMTYGILKTIVRIIKETGKELFPHSVIRVGETFDIGPEFSISDFKYTRHREITSGSKLDGFGFVDATALLCGDSRPYAAYPNGIPDKTPFATFLGKQSNIFLKDIGFDYLWLSNGLGFSANPWAKTGKIFDGKSFHPEKLANTAKQVFDFWRLFRIECPDIPLETRGTNNSVGIDYATDGVPLYDIYNGDFNMTPPPNSPWAALNYDFGLEIMGHMTRICELPDKGFMFRYYIHDPWWVNSPWYDRYGGSAHDIYLPLAITRIDKDGKVQSADTLNILTIDNSFGDMPDCCVNEPLPHLLKAEKDAADMPSPLVWVYPMKEYTSAKTEEELFEMYYGDTYIKNAINLGLPLNCVVSTDNFLSNSLDIYKASVLVSPIPESAEIAAKLKEYTKNGGKVLYYGSKEKAEKCDFKEMFADIKGDPAAIRENLKEFGISIDFNLKSGVEKTAVIALTPYDNALLFSVHNVNLTTETLLKFPLGAPVLTGMDTEIKNGFASYNFGSCEHRECRIFVEQKDGVISCKELAPGSNMYHRKVSLKGLKNATVRIFPENNPKKLLAIANFAPSSDQNPNYVDYWQRVEDKKWGIYYEAKNISGDYHILLHSKK